MPRRRDRQRGIALLVVVGLIAVGATFLLLRSLNAATWRADRYRVTQEALVKAKEALIARAVADDNRPGSLPCPDTNNDGNAELFVGNQCPSYVGRLPWKTLDLPDLHDASGERLWYVLSPTHRDHAAAEPINSDTVGQLSLAGTQPAADLLAIVVAPGIALVRAGAATIQDRSCTTACSPDDFLDISGGVDNAVGNSTLLLVSAPESGTFNDRLLAINADDVMPLVEKRAGREISLAMRARYEGWQAKVGRGFYPWAAPFDDPANPGLGVNGTLHGHFPVTTAPVVWTAASVTVGTCSGVGTPTLDCTAVLLLGDVTARVDNIATRFLEPPTPPQVGGLALGSNYSYTLNAAAQRMQFQYNALLGITQITIQAPALASWAPATAPWLVNNQWDRVTTYAISDGHKITGPGACTGPNPCISIGGLADKEAVVMMAGRPLAAQARTVPAQVPDYLEGLNTTPDDMELERDLRTTAFNDQPVVVRP